jgi:hypothetical protein
MISCPVTSVSCFISQFWQYMQRLTAMPAAGGIPGVGVRPGADHRGWLPLRAALPPRAPAISAPTIGGDKKERAACVCRVYHAMRPSDRRPPRMVVERSAFSIHLLLFG